MKTWYFCETCGKKFESAEDALACEVAHEAAEAKKKKLAEEKKKRTDEIQDLISKFVEDYHEAPKVHVVKEFPESLISWFLN